MRIACGCPITEAESEVDHRGVLGFDARPLSLPFELGEGGPVPVRLEINLVTEGSGRFWLGPLTIVPVESDTGTTETSVATSVASVTTLAPTTTGPVTTTVVALGTEPDDPSLLLAVAVIVLAAEFGGTGWLAARRRRQAAEQRRLDAIDSMWRRLGR